MTAFILVGTVALSAVQVCQLDVAYAVLFDIWSKSMKHQFLTPIGIRHLAVGSWLVGVARGVIGLRAHGPDRLLGFRLRLHRGGPGAPRPLPPRLLPHRARDRAPRVRLVLLFGTRAETSAWAAVNFVVMLSGIYYPVSVLPGWVQAISARIPLTYFLDAFRAGYGFASAVRAPVAQGLRPPVLYVVLAHWALAAAITRSRRTGLLLKLSE